MYGCHKGMFKPLGEVGLINTLDAIGAVNFVPIEVKKELDRIHGLLGALGYLFANFEAKMDTRPFTHVT